MIGIVLAAGRGVRLRPFTYFLPKPLLPVPSKSLIQIQISFLRGLGCDRVFVTSKYRKNTIKRFLSKSSVFIMEVEGEGNAGFLRELSNKISEQKIVVITCDNLMKIKREEFISEYSRLDESFLVCVPSEMSEAGDIAVYEKGRLVKIERQCATNNKLMLSGLQVINLRDISDKFIDENTNFYDIWRFLINSRKLKVIDLQPTEWSAIDKPRDLIKYCLDKLKGY